MSRKNLAMSGFTRYRLGLLASLLGGAMLAGACNPSTPSETTQPVRIAGGQAAIGGAYTLVNQDGETVTQADFLGRPQLLYFGFAFCPDVCPTALQQMGAALSLAGKDAQQFQSIFITVDAERDTPERLSQYVTANGFPKGLIGLTGSAAQIEVATKAYSVYAAKADDPSSAAGFTYDHSSIIYLMDKDGVFVDLFTHDDTPAEIAARLKRHLKTGA